MDLSADADDGGTYALMSGYMADRKICLEVLFPFIY